ncbi:predicted protein [Sclerotinia sclerotiorum 1980 UF-70]|uniref:Uncharacterized protein n=1 Tax=Sclerotinia sclerotiorum (strain ATCC 18683 / 1980 / Ss-1) TaxID=665079 RepID=A7F7N4_SCLS1|nr:predicted protein [Sclerotinia sclerotiorum 1980 UF-70]EDN98755.1 predicted protein [Sclerotinia sclerotiorum 1980 UF-70]
MPPTPTSQKRHRSPHLQGCRIQTHMNTHVLQITFF